MSTWWGSRKQVTARMVFEIEAMRMLFSDKNPILFRQNVSWDGNFWVATHKLTLNTDCPNPFWDARFRMTNDQDSRSKINSRDMFHIQVLYTSNYPSSEPQANLKSHKIAGAEHYFSDGGKLCLHAHRTARDGWDPAKSTAATIALWAIQWTRAWLYWKQTTVWPKASE